VQSVQLAAGGTRTYCYDANGNLTSDSAGLAIQYDHQNLPTKATRGSQTDWFRYGPDGLRTRSWGADGARVYLPGYEHRTDTGETKVYVGDYAVISRLGSTRKVEYLLKDRLGSVDAVANASGAVIETRGYDAFGKPRDGAWNDLTPAKIASTAVTPKGFTQHEHLNQLELIHMNGRAYDYHLGRFTGVDPFIQFPLNSQSLNPYSYILNNPLSGTDPTGYCSTDAGTGSNIKTGCVTVTAVMEDGSTKSLGSYNPRNADDMASAYGNIIPGVGTRDNGERVSRGPKGPDPNAYKRPQEVGGKPKNVEESGSKVGQTLRGMRDGLANELAYQAWTNDYACERMGGCAAGEGYSPEALGSPLLLPFPDPPDNLEQELGRDLAPAVAILPALFMRKSPSAVTGLRRADDMASLNRHMDEIADAPSAPGSVGAAQVWSMKGRLKAAQLPTAGRIRYVPPRGYNPSNPLPRGPQDGFIDRFGNEWTRGPSRTAGQAFEWDVQLSRTGRAQLGWLSRDEMHLNVSLDGHITHR
jgi:RHS repeat-associated protein